MTPLLAVWIALLVVFAVAVNVINHQVQAGQISQRDALTTILIVAGLILATVTVLALVEPQP